jgi:hypothetical protein
MTDLEERLRDTLVDRARQAPAGAPLADRILTELDASVPVLRPRRGWRTWSLPLLAAAAVAAVVTGVVGLGHVRFSAAPAPAVSHQAPRPSDAGPPSSSAPTRTGAPTRVRQTSAAPSYQPPPPPPALGVTGFRVVDLTFASETQGWALGSADCVSGPGRCTALLRTEDGSTTWQSFAGAAFDVPGVPGCETHPATCVDHLRFATNTVGYAYGSERLYMTTDGGTHWTLQPGPGAEALETLSDNVIRVVSDGPGCPGPCNVRVETSAIGSSTWHAVALAAGQVNADGVVLARSEHDAYVLLTANPAGGAGRATSTLYVSTNDGQSWSDRGEPCPQSGGEVDSASVAASPHGVVTVLCRPRLAGGGRAFVGISRDAGTSFAPLGSPLPRNAENLLAGDPDTVLIAAGAHAYRYRSGTGWSRIDAISGSADFVGFESTSTGRVVTNGGRSIWSTFDGTGSWSAYTFR